MANANSRFVFIIFPLKVMVPPILHPHGDES
jgi:hypothetical protein